MAKTWLITGPQVQEDFSGTILEEPAANGASFIAGSFVKLVSGALVASITADASTFGVALGPPTYVAGIGPAIASDVPVFRARAGQRVVLNLNGVGAAAQIGSSFGLIVNASGIALVDPTNTTEKMFEIVKFSDTPTDQILGMVGDTNPRVLVEILANAVQ